MANYAEQHTQFVSNLNGTTFSEIMLVSMPLPLSMFLVPTLLPLLWPALFAEASWLPEKHAARLAAILEFCTVLLPTIGSLTVLADHSSRLCVFLLAAAALGGCAATVGRRPASLTSALRRADVSAPRLPCVTNARAHLMLVTVVCILAVDYPVFPRRLAKAETFGAGLMDMAVGCFVVSHGMTSAAARVPAGPRRPLRQRLAEYGRSARAALLLAALGAVRLLLVTATGYHQHVSEYGVHWNFFLTLAAVKLVAPFWLLAVPASLSAAVAVLLTLLQQQLLDGGLQRWVTDEAPRRSLVEANREAFASLTGFLALYFVGVALGWHLQRPRAGWLRWLGCWARLALAAAGLWRLAAGMNVAAYPVSRRLANATYVVACAAASFSGLAVYLLLDLATVLLQRLGVVPRAPAVRVPRLMAAASRHGLALFCLANAATGAINLATRTIEAGDGVALAVISAYSAALTAAVVWFDTRDMDARPARRKLD